MDRSRELEPLIAPEPPDLPEAETAEERMARRRTWLGRLIAPIAVLIGVVVKFGAFALKFFGIFLAVGGYALIWGLPFAVGFVLLILAHELGHYVEAKRLGLDPQLPVFIPFLGAYVALRNARFDPWRNARVSIAGPIAGGAAAFGVYAAGELGDSRLLLALAYTAFLLNLLNLLPVWILDGAQVLSSWRVLRRGGGAATPAEARRLSMVVAVLAVTTAVALVAGMLIAHVPQDRL
ncbi:MAG TPA: site-2 protease family protein [Gaiella sp.]|jgi:Zn-dependent protease